MRCGGIFDLPVKEADVRRLDEKMAAPDFWDDGEAAQKIIAESNRLKLWTVPYNELKSRFQDVKDLLPEAEAIGDSELIKELTDSLQEIESRLSDLEVRKMLGGELDERDCYLEVNAGAGG